jgi:hypothetical protein
MADAAGGLIADVAEIRDQTTAVRASCLSHDQAGEIRHGAGSNVGEVELAGIGFGLSVARRVAGDVICDRNHAVAPGACNAD